jgi:hypothetical protein
VRDIFILNEMLVQGDIYIYFGRHVAVLKYFNCSLVRVLAMNYKQHILSVGRDVYEIFLSYKSLGTSGLDVIRPTTFQKLVTILTSGEKEKKNPVFWTSSSK